VFLQYQWQLSKNMSAYEQVLGMLQVFLQTHLSLGVVKGSNPTENASKPDVSRPSFADAENAR
jgi:hypothetical protein